MLRRIIATLLVVLGLTSVGLGVASATIWRSSDTVTASLPQDPQTPVVLVMPGVLTLAADHVSVTATAADSSSPVVLAFGRADDVTAWVGDAPHTDVVGLASWSELATETTDPATASAEATEDTEGEASGDATDDDASGDAIEEEATLPDPASSDLWTQTFTGTGEVSADLTPDQGQVILLVATDGTAPAPQLTLTWTVPVSTPYLIPLVVVGTLLVVAGVALAIYQLLLGREERQREAAREHFQERVKRQEESTQVFRLPVDTSTLTRRQLRELQRRMKEESPRFGAHGPVKTTAGAVGAGIVPGVADPEGFRALRYVELPDDDAESTPADTAEQRRAAGPAAGAAIVPGRDVRAAAGPAAGAGILPGRAETPEDAPQHDEQATTQRGAWEQAGADGWRALWHMKEDER